MIYLLYFGYDENEEQYINKDDNGNNAKIDSTATTTTGNTINDYTNRNDDNEASNDNNNTTTTITITTTTTSTYTATVTSSTVFPPAPLRGRRCGVPNLFIVIVSAFTVGCPSCCQPSPLIRPWGQHRTFHWTVDSHGWVAITTIITSNQARYFSHL